MTDLVSAIPPHEPSEDALAYAGKAALSAIPVVGPLIAEGIAHALDARQAQRQHEFNSQIAYALTDALKRLDSGLTIEDVTGSDEFIAAVTRAQRVASETASHEKRRRLATAAVNGGAWAPFSKTEREQFTRLVDEFDDLHVFLLHYFNDPKSWLDAHGLQDTYVNIHTGTVGTPLSAVLGVPESEWRDPVAQAVSDLTRNALADVPLRTIMMADGVLTSRTGEKGRRFLAFLNEPDSVDVASPSL